MPSISGASHVALTVRDKDASAEWYKRVFGWTELARLDGTQAGSPRVLVFDPASGFVIALCQPDDASGDDFDYRRIGLDHLAFGVADLDEWAAYLDGLDVEHSPVRDVPPLGSFISFEDPDGIQFELWRNAG